MTRARQSRKKEQAAPPGHLRSKRPVAEREFLVREHESELTIEMVELGTS